MKCRLGSCLLSNAMQDNTKRSRHWDDVGGSGWKSPFPSCVYVAPPSQAVASHWELNTLKPLLSLALLLNPRCMFQSHFSWSLSGNWHYWSFSSKNTSPSLVLRYHTFLVFLPESGFPPRVWFSHFRSPMQADLSLPNHHTGKFLLVSPSSSVLFPYLTPYISIVLITSDLQM